MQLIFVFGTLKRGFPLSAKLGRAAFVGLARTVQPFPMFVAGGIFGPMMLDRPGRGFRVHGELYEVCAEDLAAVDEAEGNGLPGNFRRPIPVICTARREWSALAFFKDPRLARPRRSGYLMDYRDGRFRPKGERPVSQPPLKLLSAVSRRAG